MHISRKMTIKEIQEQFTTKFPGLKIEFYDRKHRDFKGSNIVNQFPNSLQMAEINEHLMNGLILLDPEQTVIDLENEFEARFGLHVQIFRRSKDLWLQTSTTDDWSLRIQNEKGIHSTLIL